MVNSRRFAPSWPGFVPAIHVLLAGATIKAWMPGTSPGMTIQKRPRYRGLGSHHTPPIKSARIEVDDHIRLHLDREGHVRQSGDAAELCRHLGMIDFEEIWHVALGKLNGFQNGGELF